MVAGQATGVGGKGRPSLKLEIGAGAAKADSVAAGILVMAAEACSRAALDGCWGRGCTDVVAQLEEDE